MAEAPKEFTIIVCFEDERRQRFLLVRHRDRGWELPGGRPEPGEGPLHAALREFREETGHILGRPRLVLKQQRTNGLCWVFTGNWGPRAEATRSAAEAVQEWRFVARMGDVGPLAFPDDPYEEIEKALKVPLR